MPCHHCARDYSLFNRETACPICGFGHCSGCLKQKVILPKTGKEGRVCPKCHKNLTTVAPAPPPSPPKALQKRLERLEPTGPPRGLSSEDQKIAQRLEKLHQEKRGQERQPTEEEVRQRLQRLKGTPNEQGSSNPSYLFKSDQRTGAEQSSDLFSTMKEEVDLEKSQGTKILSPEEDISSRLAHLKGEVQPKIKRIENEPNPLEYINRVKGGLVEDEDLDQVTRLMKTVEKEAEREARGAMEELQKDKAIQEQLARLRVKPPSTVGGDENVLENNISDEEDAVIKQIMAEQKLEERLGSVKIATASSGEPEELPWCVICNEDAVVRCKGCDGDLYCSPCSREFHVDEDPKEHMMTKFTK